MEVLTCLTLVVPLLITYLIGSVPSGYWICHYILKIDITKHGSGNIGASNVGRIAGKQFFFIVFFLDALKAWVALYLFASFITNFLATTAYADYASIMSQGILSTLLLVGNAHSIFLRFKGGKGVATALGILLYVAPWELSSLFMICWIFILALTKEAFMASLGGMFLVLVASWWYDPQLPYLICTIFCWLIIRHNSNIRNICARCCPCPWTK